MTKPAQEPHVRDLIHKVSRDTAAGELIWSGQRRQPMYTAQLPDGVGRVTIKRVRIEDRPSDIPEKQYEFTVILGTPPQVAEICFKSFEQRDLTTPLRELFKAAQLQARNPSSQNANLSSQNGVRPTAHDFYSQLITRAAEASSRDTRGCRLYVGPDEDNSDLSVVEPLFDA